MGKKKNGKAKSPEQMAAERMAQRARDFESVELQREASVLRTSDSIEVRRSGQQTVAGARRQDAFDALRDKMAPGAYDAVRRLEKDMREQRGEADRGRGSIRVDNHQRSHTSDFRIAASKRVEDALGRIGERDAWLLSELIYPTIQRDSWRHTVYHITGEENPVAQGAAVRSACANLAAAYERKVAA